MHASLHFIAVYYFFMELWNMYDCHVSIHFCPSVKKKSRREIQEDGSNIWEMHRRLAFLILCLCTFILLCDTILYVCAAVLILPLFPSHHHHYSLNVCHERVNSMPLSYVRVILITPKKKTCLSFSSLFDDKFFSFFSPVGITHDEKRRKKAGKQSE